MTESATGDLIARIDRLESRAAIAELCASYCIACDDQDLPSLRGLFTEDAVVRARNGTMRATGIGEVMAMFTAMFVIRGPSFHWTHDRRVTFDPADPDRATGQVLAHAETTPDGRPSVAALRYEDVYRRQDERWFIARRQLTFLYYTPVADYPDRLGRAERVWAGDRWVAADYPEALGPWATWGQAWPTDEG